MPRGYRSRRTTWRHCLPEAEVVSGLQNGVQPRSGLKPVADGRLGQDQPGLGGVSFQLVAKLADLTGTTIEVLPLPRPEVLTLSDAWLFGDARGRELSAQELRVLGATLQPFRVHPLKTRPVP